MRPRSPSGPITLSSSCALRMSAKTPKGRAAARGRARYRPRPGLPPQGLFVAQADAVPGRSRTRSPTRRGPASPYQGEVSAERPGATYVPHQRYVVDRGVATTTGVTASVPMTIALVEAIAGTERAQALAADLGLSTWTPAHDSNRFGLNARRRWAYIVDSLAFWRRDQRAIDVSDGTDDVALALAADAWSRTRLTRVEAAAPTPTVRLRSGLVLVARDVGPEMRRVALAAGLKPVQQLERTLSEIGHQYGVMRRDRVEQELEYASASMAR